MRNFVVLTADQVLQDGDVVSHYDGSGTTAIRTPVNCMPTMNINCFEWVVQGWFWTTPSVGIHLQTPWAPRLFRLQCFYNSFVFFRDFPVV